MEIVIFFVGVIFVIGWLFEYFEYKRKKEEKSYKLLIDDIRKKEKEYIEKAIKEPTVHVKRPGDWEIRRKYILEKDGNKCKLCGDDTCLHVHHKVPVSVAPDHSEENLITLCIYCHSKQKGEGHGKGMIEREIMSRCKRFRYIRRKSRTNYNCYSCKIEIKKGSYSYVEKLMNTRICEKCLLRK